MSAFPPPSELLPHSGKMVLLDEVVAADEDRLVAHVTLRPDSQFVTDGSVPALVAIEYMAQAIGAWAGLQGLRKGEPIRIGYLLGTRELTLDVDAFAVGDELTVEVRHVWGDDQLGSFQCSVVRAGHTVAAGLLNVYRGSEVPPQ